MLLVEHTHPDLVFVAYYMKLELTWIIANLTYGSDHLCLDILTDGPISPTQTTIRNIPMATQWKG